MRPRLLASPSADEWAPSSPICSFSQPFRVLIHLFIAFFLLIDWRWANAQQSQEAAGKNHLHGIRRLSPTPEEQPALWEHRHLRHIPSPRDPSKSGRPSLLGESKQQQQQQQRRMIVHGGGEPRPPIAQRVPIPIREAPSPAFGLDERTVLAMSSAEAEHLAQRLLNEAGMNPQSAEAEEQQPPLTKPPPQTTIKHPAAPRQLNPVERNRMERIQARWSKIGPLLRSTNASAALLPLRRLRLRRRKLMHKDSRQRLAAQSQNKQPADVPSPSSSSSAPRHAASATRTTPEATTTVAEETTTSPAPMTTAAAATVTAASGRRTDSHLPRALQLPTAVGVGRQHYRVAARPVDTEDGRATEPESQQQFDIESTRQALLQAQQAHQQRQRQLQQLQQQQQAEEQSQQSSSPRGWEPTLRLLRHRHRNRVEQQPSRHRRPPIFNGPLLATDEESPSSPPPADQQQQQRQFGLRTEPRERQQGNRLEELLETGLQEGQQAAEKAAEQPSPSSRRPVQVERRFRLVPNKVVFRPRLKIRRPGGPTVDSQQPLVGSNIAAGSAVARGTDQQRGQAPIALPALGTFGGQQPPEPQPVPVPPAPDEPPPRLAPPPPEALPQTEPPPTPAPSPPPPPPPPEPKPLPAMEIGSVGEQPPQNIAQGGPPTTTTGAPPAPAPPPAAQPPPAASEQQQPNPAPAPPLPAAVEDVILGEGASASSDGSGLGGGAGVGPSDDPGPLPPGFSEAGSGFIGGGAGADNGLSFGAELGTPPPGFKEAFGLNGFETSLGAIGGETSTTTSAAAASTESTSSTASTAAPTTIAAETQSTTTTTVAPTTTAAATTTTAAPTTTQPPSTPAPPPPAPPAPAPAVEPIFAIPENSGLRPVAPPREFLNSGGFGSSGGGGRGGGVVGASGGGGGGGSGFGGPSNGALEPPPPNAQVEPPQQPLKPDDFFTGESAFMPNKRGPEGDGYGPSVLPGAPIPPPPAGPAIGVGGAAAGIPLRPVPNAIGGPPVPEPPPENEATTVKPSALLNIINKADEGFNQVITHFEQGTPLEAAAIDIMEVALGSQKLDSQAKLLSHVDRAFGLDNLQRLQRWANTGGALDLIKEQFAKIAKNYKPPQETVNLFTVPPQLEYLFQSGGSSGGKRRR